MHIGVIGWDRMDASMVPRLLGSQGIADLYASLRCVLGAAGASRDRAIFHGLHSERTHAEEWGALQYHPVDAELVPGCDLRLLQRSAFPMDNPWADRLYPPALGVTEHLHVVTPTVILSDGDAVLPHREVWRSGLTVFPHQDHDALNRAAIVIYPTADLNIERIGDLLTVDVRKLLAHRGQ